MPIDTRRPSKSLDFGEDGYTASLTTWHELLQLTAPDASHGVVCVRGDFPDGASSILARAQRRNERGTFGLDVGVVQESSSTPPPSPGNGNGDPPECPRTVLEQTPAQGMINMRWPCTRLRYVRGEPCCDGASSTVVADYTACSFVKDGALYQVVRIAPRQPDTPASSIEGPEKLLPVFDVEISVGGLVRFACSRSTLAGDDTPHWPLQDSYSDAGGAGPSYAMGVVSQRYGKKLEVRLWINGRSVEMRQNRDDPRTDERLGHPPSSGADEGYDDEVSALRVSCRRSIARDPVVIVASMALVEAEEPTWFGELPVISSDDIQRHLGMAAPPLRTPYMLWSHLLQEPPGVMALELNSVGRCAETILNVSAVPVAQEGWASEDSSGCQESPIQCIALLKNIMLAQCVDLESTL